MSARSFFGFCFIVAFFNIYGQCSSGDVAINITNVVIAPGINSTASNLNGSSINSCNITNAENCINNHRIGILKGRTTVESPYYRLEAGQSQTIFDGKDASAIAITNVGQTQILMEYYDGPSGSLLDQQVIEPGHLINVRGKSYKMKIDVKNQSPDRIAFVFAKRVTFIGGNCVYPSLISRIDGSKVLKQTVLFGLEKIPYAGSVLAFTVDSFWPSGPGERDIWSEIKDQVQDLIDQTTTEILNGLLNGEVEKWKEQLRAFMSDVQAANSTDIAAHYLNIAQSFIGEEKKFSSMLTVRSNFFILPFYSSVVLMKVMFYTYGINCQQEIGLTLGDVESIKRYRDVTLKGATEYLPKLYADMLEIQYNDLNPENAYNLFAEIKTLYVEYGLEFMKIWNNIVTNNVQQVRYDDVRYSRNALGMETPEMNAILTQADPSALIGPKLISPGKRDKLVSIILCWDTKNYYTLNGLKLQFDSGEVRESNWMCDKDPNRIYKQVEVDLRKADKYINKIEMKTNENSYIEQLTFHFTDGSPPVTTGEAVHNTKDWTWHEPDTVLLSLYVTQDPMLLGNGLSVNLFVVYQQNNLVDTSKFLPAKCK